MDIPIERACGLDVSPKKYNRLHPHTRRKGGCQWPGSSFVLSFS